MNRRPTSDNDSKPGARNAPVHVSQPSPCVRICKLDARQVCIGCGRHINEIIAAGSAVASPASR